MLWCLYLCLCLWCSLCTIPPKTWSCCSSGGCSAELDYSKKFKEIIKINQKHIKNTKKIKNVDYKPDPVAAEVDVPHNRTAPKNKTADAPARLPWPATRRIKSRYLHCLWKEMFYTFWMNVVDKYNDGRTWQIASTHIHIWHIRLWAICHHKRVNVIQNVPTVMGEVHFCTQ